MHSSHLGYHVFERRVILRGTLTLLSGLHIGCGRDIGASASDLPVLKDVGGRPFIPGSSLKGVLRSCAESFLRAFQTMTTLPLSCTLVGAKPGMPASDKWKEEDQPGEFDPLGPCIPDVLKKELIGKPDADALLWKKSCWVCCTFGSPWLASKVRIIDLSLVSSWRPEMLQIRDGVAIDRESETAADKMKYDFEVVPLGAGFRLEMILENPEDHELGIVALGLEMLNDGLALLGGDTSRGLGRVRVEIDEIDELTPALLLERLRGSAPVEPSPPEGVSEGGGKAASGKAEMQKSPDRPATETQAASKRIEAANNVKLQSWKNALYNAIQEATKESTCTPPSITRQESSTA